MALTYPEALKMMAVAGNREAFRLIKSVVTVDALFAYLPLIPTNQMAIPIAREGLEPTFGEFASDTKSDAVEESVGSDDLVFVQLRTMMGDVDVQSMIKHFTPEQISHHIQKKIKAQAEKVKEKFITGGHTTGFTATGTAGVVLALETSGATFSPWLDSSRRGVGSIKYTDAGTLWQFRAPGDIDYGPAVAVAADGFATLTSHNPSYWMRVNIDVSDAAGANGEVVIRFTSSTNEADGIKRLIPTSQTVDPDGANGDLFSLSKFDELLNMVKVGDRPAFFMSGAFINRYKEIMRSFGGATPETVQLPSFNGKPMLAYQGVPILRNDNCALDETVGTNTCGSIYLANLDDVDGLSLGVGNPQGGSQVDPQSDPYKAPMLGWHIEDIGTRQDMPRHKTRVTFYGAPILKSVLAAARASGIRNATV